MPYHDEDKNVTHEMYKGAKSGHQDHSATGSQPDYQPAKAGTLTGQVKNAEYDAGSWGHDTGGLSTKFGKGGPGDNRGSGDKRGDHDINEPVHPSGNSEGYGY